MLQRAAGWVFENPREVENRHALFAAEVARSALTGSTVSNPGDVSNSASEGARIAYYFGVVGQSRDALKALADSRKRLATRRLSWRRTLKASRQRWRVR